MTLLVISLFLSVAISPANGAPEASCPSTPQDCYLKRIEQKLDAVLQLLKGNAPNGTVLGGLVRC